MRLYFTSLFNKDISRIHNEKLVRTIEEAIENVKCSKTILEIRNLKKLKGYKKHYRIRIGDYRIGLFIVGNIAEFSRFMHRKDIYRYFPE